jgi:hypothetical protein
MSRAPLVVRWRLRRARMPRILGRCAGCAAQSAFEPTGRFRVNANRKTLDVWLLLRCVACARVLKATVAERVPVRSIPPAVLAGYQRGDPGLVARVVTDPSFRRRNRLALDDDGAWELDAEPVPPDRARVRVEVELADPLRVRPIQLIAAGLGVSRNQVERMLATGVIRSAAPLGGQTSTGFGFSIERRRSLSPAGRSPGGGRGGDRSPPRRVGAGGWRPAG